MCAPFWSTCGPSSRFTSPSRRGSLDFPVNLLVKFAPKPVTGPVRDADRVGHGGATASTSSRSAGCRECHSPHDDKGQLVAGTDFSGGWVMLGPWGRVVSANITPDPDNFMGRASREEFIGRFKSFEGLDGENAPVAPAGRNTVMPWARFAGMTREDLGAIYDYLKTLPPIQKKVDSFPDAKDGGAASTEGVPRPRARRPRGPALRGRSRTRRPRRARPSFVSKPRV